LQTIISRNWHTHTWSL